MSSIHPIRSSERGAILIHVGIGLAVMLAFCAFVVDYGVMWASRRQAQNASDAAAMAGALALIFDDVSDRTDGGPAKQSAVAVGQANRVWGLSPVITPADVTFPICPDGSDACLRADVFRNQARGSPLPTFFARLVGVMQQGVRATATAQVLLANASDCLKPWAIADKWVENFPIPDVWTPDDAYEKYVESGPNKGLPLPNPDLYQEPSASGPGTGFTLANDYGRQLVMKPANPLNAIAPGWFFAVDLPRASGPIVGGDKYRENIATCNSVPIGIGETLQNEPGNKTGPTVQGVEELIAQDPSAYWDPADRKVKDSCASENPPCATRSPRIVSIPVFDTDVYEEGRQTGRLDLVIVNILGYFIEDVDSNDVIGYLTNAPGLLKNGVPGVSDESSFIKTVVLVQ